MGTEIAKVSRGVHSGSLLKLHYV